MRKKIIKTEMEMTIPDPAASSLATHRTRDTPDQGMQFSPIPGWWLDLSPDGKTIAVTGFKGSRVRLYSADDLTLPSIKLVPDHEPATHDTACAFSQDGARLFVANVDGWVRVFDVATRRELAADYGSERRISAERVDPSGVASIVVEAASARNGWKVILARCAPTTKPRSALQLAREMIAAQGRASSST